VRYALKKQLAVRFHQRLKTVGDVDAERLNAALAELGTDPEELNAIYRLTTLATDKERFVIPPSHREQAEEMLQSDLWQAKGEAGIGMLTKASRGA
jgi:nitrate reductase beta subunit